MANAKGFVVAYPDGVRRSWNAGGGCCGPASRDKVDDVGFITAMIRAISRAQNIDPKRIYLTGISNGAAMSYRYACAGSIPIAAIGSVAGTMPGGCSAPHSLSVIEIHGLKDQNIPFDGGVGTKGVVKLDWPSVQTSLDIFRRADHCGTAEVNVAGVVATSVNSCTRGDQVTLITISDAGHQWPGATPNRPMARVLLNLDPPSSAMNATAVLWEFFQRHTAS
jgi:polyhydroxybutyrate depolymerase